MRHKIKTKINKLSFLISLSLFSSLLSCTYFYPQASYGLSSPNLNNAYAATYVKGVFSDVAAQQNSKTDDQTVQSVGRFKDSVEIVREMYVDQLSDSKIFDKAIAGLMAQLDPHSEYLDEDEYKALKIATSGEFVGIGAEVTMDDKDIKVVTPLDDSPAQKAGVQPGDIILKINDTPIQGMGLEEAIKLIRGKPGTSLTLTIFRKGQEKPLVLKLVRAEIKVVSVKNELIDGHYGYIRISSFQLTTATELHKAIDQLLLSAKGQLRGVVLDLRNNPGGLLPISIEVADTFLDTNDAYENYIVSTKGRTGESDSTGVATPGDQINGIPVVALINQGSASASEIVAAALQDHHRAVIMGERSFGKGSVQTVIPLSDGKTGIKITTARFYSPSGRPIQGEGVTPDVQIDALKLDQAVNPAALNYRETDLAHSLNPERPDVVKAGDQAQTPAQTPAQTQSQQLPDPKTDYQLSSALSLLKGLYITNNSQINNQTANTKIKPQK